MGKFKKGDRVKLVDCGNTQAGYGLKAGSVGTVNEDESSCPYVIYDDAVGLVATNEDRLELLQDAEATGMTQDEIGKAREIPGIKSNTTTRTPLTIEAGKYYRTRDGRKVGPMESWYLGGWHADRAPVPLNGGLWNDDGTAWFENSKDSPDLIAEWVDEPAVESTAAETTTTAPTNDNAPSVATTDVRRFKIGDKVRTLADEGEGRPTGSVGAVVDVGLHYVQVDFEPPFDGWGEGDRFWSVQNEKLELIAPAEEAQKLTSADGSTVMDVTNGVLTMEASKTDVPASPSSDVTLKISFDTTEITEAIKSTLLRTKQGYGFEIARHGDHVWVD